MPLAWINPSLSLSILTAVNHVNLTDGEIAEKVKQLFDLRPAAIERDLELRNPIYEETAKPLPHGTRTAPRDENLPFVWPTRQKGERRIVHLGKTQHG